MIGFGVLSDPGPERRVSTERSAEAATGRAEASADSSTSTSAPPVTAPDDGKTAAQRTLSLVDTITDPALRPKSVVASGSGLFFFAQNMMYAHNVAVYNRDLEQVKVIDDEVVPAFFDLPGNSALKGGPVEAVFTSDGSAAYVSQYKLYGPGQDNPGTDVCTPSASTTASSTGSPPTPLRSIR